MTTCGCTAEEAYHVVSLFTNWSQKISHEEGTSYILLGTAFVATFFGGAVAGMHFAEKRHQKGL